jgi:hypothetical protein
VFVVLHSKASLSQQQCVMPNFLFEVGTEELPATFVDSAIKQWL